MEGFVYGIVESIKNLFRFQNNCEMRLIILLVDFLLFRHVSIVPGIFNALGISLMRTIAYQSRDVKHSTTSVKIFDSLSIPVN